LGQKGEVYMSVNINFVLKIYLFEGRGAVGEGEKQTLVEFGALHGA